MSGERQALDMSLDDFDDFEPKPKKARPAADTRKAVDKVSSFPSREKGAEGQMNIGGDQAILDRFKAMCKEDRRSYAAMLEILMDNFESQAKT